MEVTCLSIPNPVSYLICAGIKDVENRDWNPDYRGTIYIHSTGRQSFRGMPEFAEFPVPVIHEFNEKLNVIQDLDRSGSYIGFADGGVRVYLKDEDAQNQSAVNQYALLSDAYASYRKDPDKPFFHANAIIGTVDLVDVIKSSGSKWAENGFYHWILEKPVLFREPVARIGGSKNRLWQYELSE